MHSWHAHKVRRQAQEIIGVKKEHLTPLRAWGSYIKKIEQRIISQALLKPFSLHFILIDIEANQKDKYLYLSIV